MLDMNKNELESMDFPKQFIEIVERLSNDLHMNVQDFLIQAVKDEIYYLKDQYGNIDLSENILDFLEQAKTELEGLI